VIGTTEQCCRLTWGCGWAQADRRVKHRRDGVPRGENRAAVFAYIIDAERLLVAAEDDWDASVEHGFLARLVATAPWWIYSPEH